MPKRTDPLTDLRVRRAKPGEQPYRLADGKGLYLQVMPNGSRYWRMKYRFDGKEKLASFGVYPEVSLAEARQACLAARKLLATGTDPTEQKREIKRARAIEASSYHLESAAIFAMEDRERLAAHVEQLPRHLEE